MGPPGKPGPEGGFGTLGPAGPRGITVMGKVVRLHLFYREANAYEHLEQIKTISLCLYKGPPGARGEKGDIGRPGSQVSFYAIAGHISMFFMLTTSLCVRRVYLGLLVQKVKRASLVLRQVSVWLKAVIVHIAYERFSLTFIFVSINFLQGTRGVEGNIGSPGITGPRVRQPYLYALYAVMHTFTALLFTSVFTLRRVSRVCLVIQGQWEREGH